MRHRQQGLRSANISRGDQNTLSMAAEAARSRGFSHPIRSVNGTGVISDNLASRWFPRRLACGVSTPRLQSSWLGPLFFFFFSFLIAEQKKNSDFSISKNC